MILLRNSIATCLHCLCVLTLVLVPVKIVHAAPEDLTTYTEVDEHSDLTVTANDITILSLQSQNSVTYVYKDWGSSVGDFEIDVEVDVTYADNWMWNVVFAGWSDTAGDTWEEWTDGIFAAVKKNASNSGKFAFRLSDQSETNTDESAYVNYNRFYCTYIRSGSTVTLEIYSNISRTTLVETLSITDTTTEFPYIYALSASDFASGGKQLNGEFDNIEVISTGGGGATFVPRIIISMLEGDEL